MLRKNTVFFLFFALLLTSLTFNCKKKTKIKRPNIVIIVVDTLRSDHLPFYGYNKNTTPFLNKLAKKSVLFENTYSPSSWTAPATASLFTSLYPFQHGVVLNMLATLKFNKKKSNKIKINLNRIPGPVNTLGEVMKESGYSTYLVADNLNIGDKENFTQGFDKHATFLYKNAVNINAKIKEWAEEIKKEDRYFLYIHYMDPHMPNHERAPWYKDTGDPKKNTLSRYDSEILFTDKRIEELYKLFQWDKNTLVIFTADHGEEFWDHGKKGHGYSLYREVIQVPLFFYYPDGGFKTRKFKHNVSLIDILPTLRDFLDMDVDPMHAGISLLSVLKGSSNTIPSRFLFSHIVKRNKSLNTLESFSVIHKNWHFYKKYKSENELFNLNSDIGEKTNIATEKPALVNKLISNYYKFRRKCKKYKQEIIKHKLDKKQIEHLKTLGYIQ